MDINGTSEKEKRSDVPLSVRSTSPPPDLAGETCWHSLPPELKEMIIEYLGDIPKLLRYRLVNSDWKGTVDTILERRSLFMWTDWGPLEPEPRKYENENEDDDHEEEDEDKTGSIWKYAIDCGVPRLHPTWSNLDENEFDDCDIIPVFHHPLPDFHNPKLGTAIPTNCLRIRFPDNIWPERKRFGMPRRAQMLTDFVVQYEHCFSYLRALLLTDIEINPSNLATVLRKLTMLKALTLEDTVLHLEPEGGVIIEGENSLLPPHQNLTHLRIISTNNSASDLLLKAYHEQLISLETNSWVPLFSKPYGNLKRLKLITNVKPDAQFPQGEANPFPALKYLSVIIPDGHIFEWDELIQSIDALPKTLTKLYLDVKPRWETEGEQIRQLSGSGITFPKLETVGVFLPASSQHAECLRRLIFPKFPNVQQIYLIDGSWRFRNAFNRGLDKLVGQYDIERVLGIVTASQNILRNVSRMVQKLKFYDTVCPKVQNVDSSSQGWI